MRRAFYIFSYVLAVALISALLTWVVMSYVAEDEPTTPTPPQEEREEEPETETPPEETEEPEDVVFIGLDEDEAGERADENDITWRVINRDGESLPVTMDFNPERVNFWVEDGVVVDAQTDEEMSENR